MKNYYKYLFLIIFSLFIFKPFDTLAQSYVPEDIKITFYANDGKTDHCEGMSQCYNFIPDRLAKRVQIQTKKISFNAGKTYKFYSSLKLSVPGSYSIYDYYLSSYDLRNYSINVDKSDFKFLYYDEFGGFNAYQWDLEFTVNSTFDSNGISFDFYKSQATNDQIWILDVYDFHSELISNNSDTNVIINNQNKNQQETNDRLDKIDNSLTDDDITDSQNTANSFFNDFDIKDNGGISSIVTMPLKLINSLVVGSSSCDSLTTDITFLDNTTKLSIPSGCIIWNKVPNNVLIIVQLMIYAVPTYILLKKLFKDIENLKSPNQSEVSTLDL